MPYLRLGSGRSRAAAGIYEGTRLDLMRRRIVAADYEEGGKGRWRHLIKYARIAAHTLTAAKRAIAGTRSRNAKIVRAKIAGISLVQVAL